MTSALGRRGYIPQKWTIMRIGCDGENGGKDSKQNTNVKYDWSLGRGLSSPTQGGPNIWEAWERRDREGRKEGAWSAVQRMTLVAGRTAGERGVGVA